MSKTISAEDVRLKRAYEPASAADGRRVLVDRLWPRGVTKAKVALDQWMKDIAPSPELRKWFGHDPALGRFPWPLRRGGAAAPGPAHRTT